MISALAFAIMLESFDRAASAETLTVAQADAMVESGERKGEIIRVRGYVSRPCHGRSCAIQARKGSWKRGGARLSLAGQTPAERTLVARAGQRVTLLAKIGEPTVRKMPDGNLVVCADRCDELIPISIED